MKSRNMVSPRFARCRNSPRVLPIAVLPLADRLAPRQARQREWDTLQPHLPATPLAVSPADPTSKIVLGTLRSPGFTQVKPALFRLVTESHTTTIPA